MASLADRIEESATVVSAQALDAMYASDPFWIARFGERGRSYAREDGEHHVRYLVTALRAGSPAPLVEYAKWLRRVLTSRGMCTQHIVENFERLGSAIDAAGLDPDGEAATLLEAAIHALTYPTEPAHSLRKAAPEILRQAHRATPTIADEHAFASLYSFLIDAVALGSPATFVAHYRWLSGASETATTEAILDALIDAIHAYFPAFAEAVDPIARAARSP